MFTKRHWSLSILFIALAWTSAVAQNQPTTSAQTPAPDFNIMINRKSVRFTSQTQVLEWRVEVFSQTGELVFASGQQSNSELEWSLLDQNQKPVESGLYAYTLTIKNQTGEGSYVQRGHVIVDRASTSDRVWVTSDKAIGVGAGNEGSKLTVAGTSETTVGGADVSEKTGRSSAEGRTGAERKTQGNEASDQSASTAIATADAIGPLSGEGTPGKIPKWTAPNTLGDSAITDYANGNINISGSGDVSLDLSSTSSLGSFTRLSAITSNGIQESQLQFKNKLSLGYLYKPAGSFFFNYNPVMTLMGDNVGIGTTTPTSKLHAVAGGTGNAVSGNASSGIGVSGSASSSATTGTGVKGTGYYGVVGQGTLIGVSGSASLSNGVGVSGSSTGGFGVNGSSTSSYGVNGKSSSAHGVYGQTASSNSSNAGVYGTSTANGGTGVIGQSSTGTGTMGLSDSGVGVFGQSNTSAGVSGRSTSSYGVVGSSSNSTGVSGSSTTNTGVSGSGVFGVTGYGSSIGVKGSSTDGTGVYAKSIVGAGVDANGVTGVAAYGSDIGVKGSSTAGTGVIGSSTGNGFAMQATGNTKQSFDKGGWVKAMVRYRVYWENSVAGVKRPLNDSIQCFRGDEGASGSTANTCTGFFIERFYPAPSDDDFNNEGKYKITFPFPVGDRFILITTDAYEYYSDGPIHSTSNVTATYGVRSSNVIYLAIFKNGEPADCGFTIIVF